MVTNGIKDKWRSKNENEYAQRKEEFRLLHSVTTQSNEDVMRLYYDIPTNGCKPVKITKLIIDRLMNRYGGNGFAYMAVTDDSNSVEAVKETISILKRSGLLYLPLYQYVNGEYWPYFIVFNYRSIYAPKNRQAVNLVFSGFKPKDEFYYVNPMPNQLTERMRRQREVMIWE